MKKDLIRHPRRPLAALALLLLVGCTAVLPPESAGESADDAALGTRVAAALRASRQLDSRAIEVNASDGRIRLSGFAGSMLESEVAAAVALSVAGVRAVRNEILLK